MEIKKAFGKVLREIREKRGFSREKLAELAEVEYTYIYLLEIGERQPTITTLFLLARAFEILPSELVNAVESANPRFSGRGERKAGAVRKSARKKSFAKKQSRRKRG